MRNEKLSHEKLLKRLDRAERTISALQKGDLERLTGEVEPLASRIQSLLEKERLFVENEQSAQEWQTTFDAMNDVVWILDAEHRIVRANRTGQQVFGCSVREVVGRHCWEIVHGTMEPIPECPLLRVRESKQRESMEIQVGERWLKITVDPILDADNQITRFIHIVSDITERKLAEQQLSRQTQRLISILNTMLDGYILADGEGRILDVNPSYVEMIGYSRAELLRMNIREIEAQLSPEEVTERIETMLRFGRARFETRHRDKSGSLHDLDVSVVIIPAEGGDLVAAFVRDVTGHRKAEIAAHRSEEKFRLAFQTSPDSINITRLSDGIIVEVNDAFPAITGYAKAEAIGRPTNELGLWADPHDRTKLIAELRAKGRVKDYEFLRKRKDGALLYSLISAAMIDIEGEPHLLSIIRDIDEQKKADQALAESQTRLIQAQRMAKMGDFTWDVQSGEVTWSNAMYDLLGYDMSEEIDYARVNMEIHHPDDLERVTEWLNSCIASGGNELTPNEYRLVRRDGQVIHVRTQGVIQREPGESTKVFASLLDISERKQAELKLRESEDFKDKIIETSPQGIYIADIDAPYPVFMNQRFIDLIGYTMSDHKKAGDDFTKLIHPDDQEQFSEHIKEIQNLKDGEIREIEYRVKTKAGEWIWGKAVDTVFRRDENNRVVQFLGHFIDITEKKQAEEALKKSEENFRTIYEQSPIAIQVYDRDGKLIDVNPQTLKIFGIKDKSSILGFDMWSSQKFTPEAMARVRHGKSAFVESSLDFDVVREANLFPTDKSGTIHLNLYVNPLLEAGRNTGYLVQFVDVTEQKEAEEALQESLQETTQLIQELYHRTKNNMQVIISMLMLQTRFTQRDEVKDLLQETVNRIQAMALVHEKLYQSQKLSHINLEEYIRDLTKLLVRTYQVGNRQINLTFDMEPIRSLIDTAVPCGLVLNELISNALKYAFPEERDGTIKIVLQKAGDHEIALVVSDDGIGLPEKFDVTKSESFGLHTAMTIVEYQLQGEIVFKTENGLTCQIHFPDNLYHERV